MPACATQMKTNDFATTGNMIVPVPDTDFREFLDEVVQLARFAPQLVQEIEKDLDAHGRQKKQLRLEDRRFFESRTADLPELDIAQCNILADELKLAVGRPRMPGYLVYVFMMLQGYLGSLSSKSARRFLGESMSLHAFLQSREFKMPATTTMLENVNLVSPATRELILNKQIECILKEQLDEFKDLTIDSTSVRANSCWPTDGKILSALLERAHRLGQKLHVLGLKDFRKGWVGRWLQEMDKLEFQICLNAGKANSRAKMKKHYRKLLKRGGRVADSLSAQLSRVQEDLKMETLPPSRRVLLKRMLEQIDSDIAAAKRVLDYAADRVFHQKSLPSTQKVLSVSDQSAAYIKKGNRKALIGYKPQLVRSEQGFVTSLIVPQGNAADSVKLEPVIRDSIRRTGVIAELVSSDDGYASAQGRDDLLGMGVGVVSISGSKGKKLTDQTDWDSEAYRDARRNRSAVESLMFTIKDGFEFGQLARRGIDAVRDELLGKVLAYNCSRIILIKKRRRERLQAAA